MSSLSNILKDGRGYISTEDMWPRHSASTGTLARIPHAKLAQYDAVFPRLFNLLCKRPLNADEWNNIVPASSYSKRSAQPHDLLSFEYWCSLYGEGHMPYITSWDEMPADAQQCWKNHNNLKVTKRMVFICLLGISYRH